MMSFGIIICIAIISSTGCAASSGGDQERYSLSSEDTNSLASIDFCYIIRCKNNGTCETEGGEAKCKCIPPFSGEDCSEDPCTNAPCQNGGVCDVINNSYKCTCENGFFGDICEHRTTEPPSSTKSLAIKEITSTSNTTDAIETTTEDGTTEPSSSTTSLDVDLCYEKPCKNGGTCQMNELGRFTCICPPQYYGSTCEKVEYSCEEPCEHGGECTRNGNEAECVCVEPYSGRFCEQDPCYPNPCENGGSCYIINKTRTCYCSDGYTGKNCTDDVKRETTSIATTISIKTSISPEVSIDFCYEEPCENGGTCVLDGEGYKCICSPQYSGENCVEESTASTTTSPETTMYSTAFSTREPKTTPTSPKTSSETTMSSAAISTEEPKTTPTPPKTSSETTMSSTAISTEESTTTIRRTSESESTTPTEVTTIDQDLCTSNPCLNNGSCTSIENTIIRCNCTHPFSGEFCDSDLSEKNQSSPNSIVYACAGSAGAFIFVCLIGFSVLWHLKRMKQKKREGYFHNADLSSMDSENSRTYII